VIVLTTRATPSAWEPTRLIRRRRFRFARTGALLAIIGVRRLAQVMRSGWRVSVGLSGALLGFFGLTMFTGGARGMAEAAGLGLFLFALLKGTNPVRGTVPQVTWRGPG
jgi:hypothetical protein